MLALSANPWWSTKWDEYICGVIVSRYRSTTPLLLVRIALWRTADCRSTESLSVKVVVRSEWGPRDNLPIRLTRLAWVLLYRVRDANREQTRHNTTRYPQHSIDPQTASLAPWEQSPANARKSNCYLPIVFLNIISFRWGCHLWLLSKVSNQLIELNAIHEQCSILQLRNLVLNNAP